jgi:hypothetical protein
MQLQQTREILASYGKLLGRIQGSTLFLSEELLPCSKARIRYCICHYIGVLLRLGSSQTDTIQSLMIAYSHVGFFVDPLLANELNTLVLNRHQTKEVNGQEMDQKAEHIRRINLEKKQLLQEIEDFVREEIAFRDGERTVFN